MKQTNILITTFILAIIFWSSQALAAQNIDAEDFVEEASAKGIAEIETGKLALEKGSAKTREFAQKMIEDHKALNGQLAELARANNIKISDDAGVMDKAKSMMLTVRDDSFDRAYATNQVEAHQETVELYKRAISSNLGAFSTFAKENLQNCMEHLEMAKQLQAEMSTSR